MNSLQPLVSVSVQALRTTAATVARPVARRAAPAIGTIAGGAGFGTRALSDISVHTKYYNGKVPSTGEPVNRMINLFQNGDVDEVVMDTPGSLAPLSEKGDSHDLSRLLASDSGRLSPEHKEALDKMLTDARDMCPKLSEKYLKLAHVYSFISMNPQNNDKHMKLTSANTVLHGLHWAVVDLIDKHKAEVHLNARTNYAGHIAKYVIDCIKEDDKRSIPKDALHRLGVSSDTIENVAETLKMADAGIRVFSDTFHEYYDKKHLAPFRTKFCQSMNELPRKIQLTSDIKDMTEYLDSRALTAGCFPYTNLKYLIEADVYKLDFDGFMAFQEKYDAGYLFPIELKYNKVFGVRNDRYSIGRDTEEDTANAVSLVAGNQLEALPIYFALEQVRKDEAERLREVDIGLNVLESQVTKEERQHVKLVRSCNRQEALASSIYYFFDPRHAEEAPLIRAMSNPDIDHMSKVDQVDDLLSTIKGRMKDKAG